MLNVPAGMFELQSFAGGCFRETEAKARVNARVAGCCSACRRGLFLVLPVPVFLSLVSWFAGEPPCSEGLPAGASPCGDDQVGCPAETVGAVVFAAVTAVPFGVVVARGFGCGRVEVLSVGLVWAACGSGLFAVFEVDGVDRPMF